MVPLTALAKAAGDLLLVLVTLADIGKLFKPEKSHEEILSYEKIRRDAISRYVRETGGHPVHKNTEQRSAVLSGTRRVLYVKNCKHAASENNDVGSGGNPCEYVRDEPSTVRSRKRSFHRNNGR